MATATNTKPVAALTLTTLELPALPASSRALALTAWAPSSMYETRQATATPSPADTQVPMSPCTSLETVMVRPAVSPVGVTVTSTWMPSLPSPRRTLAT